jgi:hypothetical protein
MNKKELHKFVIEVVDNNKNRNHGNTNYQGMIDNLSKRIFLSTDNGLASAVHWHKWLNYSEANHCLLLLLEMNK